MSIENRLKKLEKNQTDSNKCVCTISDNKEFLTIRVLPKVCTNCGNSRTDKEIKEFANWRLEADQRLADVQKQVKARM